MTLATKAIRVMSDNKGRRVIQDQQEIRVLLVLKVIKERRAAKEMQDRQGLLVTPASKVIRVKQEAKVIKDMAIKVTQETQVQ